MDQLASVQHAVRQAEAVEEDRGSGSRAEGTDLMDWWIGGEIKYPEET